MIFAPGPVFSRGQRPFSGSLVLLFSGSLIFHTPSSRPPFRWWSGSVGDRSQSYLSIPDRILQQRVEIRKVSYEGRQQEERTRKGFKTSGTEKKHNLCRACRDIVCSFLFFFLSSMHTSFLRVVSSRVHGQRNEDKRGKKQVKESSELAQVWPERLSVSKRRR
jgi:hypothetical protein